jgi:hypothetical protein
MSEPGARHHQTVTEQQLLGRCVKRVEWASVALTAAGGAAHGRPALGNLADYLTGTAEQLTGFEQELRGG